MILIRLYFEFFKIGLFAVGGGLATLPFLYDLAANTGWFTQADVIDMVAVSESTPGPIGINMASYVGFTVNGILGSIIATLGLITPSIIIIVMVAKFLNKFQQNQNVQSIFYGLRPASTALIAAAGVGVAKISLFTVDKFNLTGKILNILNWKSIILALLLYFLIAKFNKHPVVYIAGSAIVGIIFKFAV